MYSPSTLRESEFPAARQADLMLVDPRPFHAELLQYFLIDKIGMEKVERRDGPLADSHPDARQAPRVVMLAAHGEAVYFQSLVRNYRENCPESGMMVLDTRPNPETAVCAVRQGAIAYWTWLDPLEEVTSAIRWAAMGRPSRTPLAREWLTCGPQRLVCLPRSERPPVTLLSRTELRLFQLLARGCRSKQCAEKLNLSPESLSAHLDSLLEKLDARDESELVRRACRHGLL